MSVHKGMDSVKPSWMDETNHRKKWDPIAPAMETGDVAAIAKVPASKARSSRNRWKEGPTSGTAHMHPTR